MSRSYKKSPWCGDRKGKSKKRVANKTVRQWFKDHPDETIPPAGYKKLYETWDICDYGCYTTWEDYWQNCIEAWHMWQKDCNTPYPNKEEEYKRWCKWYYHK